MKVQVTDNGGLTDVAQATVTISNVAPTVTAVTPSSPNAIVGQPVTFTGTATDPSAPDTAAGFTWAFDAGSGFGAFGSNPFVTSFAACGTYTVSAEARDKDGGVSSPFSAAPVQVYDGSVLPPPDGPVPPDLAGVCRLGSAVVGAALVSIGHRLGSSGFARHAGVERKVGRKRMHRRRISSTFPG